MVMSAKYSDPDRGVEEDKDESRESCKPSVLGLLCRVEYGMVMMQAR